jgi:hypothetical protein
MRKRAVLVFALGNHHHYGVYWGRYEEHFDLLYPELLDMGIDLTSENIFERFEKVSEEVVV